MPLILITGTPGAGKTLAALETVVKMMGCRSGVDESELRQSIKEQDQINAVVCGVEGLDETLFQVEDDPYNWQEYPDGTVFLVDEAWKWYGSQDLEIKKDPRVLAMAEHRHRGMTFIMTAQYPGQLIPHIRALVDEHIHVRRKFGTQVTLRFRWPHLVESPNTVGAQQSAEETTWKYPVSIFGLYKSASIHTIKPRIPRKVWFMLIALGVIALCAIFAIRALAAFFDQDTVPPTHTTGAASVAQGAAVAAQEQAVDGQQSSINWLLAYVPRVQGLPQSAPIYDDFTARDYPRLACVIVGEVETSRDCRCFTQQATAVTVGVDLCRSIVRDGWFDPFREPVEYYQDLEDRQQETVPQRVRGFDLGPPQIDIYPAAHTVGPGRKPNLPGPGVKG